MTNDPHYEKLREASWQRKLTADEEARVSDWLAAHPEAQGEWESEAALNEALTRLPDVPLASNFTARVVQAAQREADGARLGEKRPGRWFAFWTSWAPKAALAAVLLAAGLVSYHRIQTVHRTELARSLTAVSQIPSLPSPEILKDFDAIAALGSTPPADEELLKIMQ